MDESSSLSVVSKFINELLEMLDFSLLRVSFPSLLLSLFHLSFFILIEITFIIMELLSLEFDNFVNDHIQEVSGVTNNDNSDVEIGDVFLKPNKSYQVQMIGRLIE